MVENHSNPASYVRRETNQTYLSCKKSNDQTWTSQTFIHEALSFSLPRSSTIEEIHVMEKSGWPGKESRSSWHHRSWSQKILSHHWEPRFKSIQHVVELDLRTSRDEVNQVGGSRKAQNSREWDTNSVSGWSLRWHHITTWWSNISIRHIE